MRTITTIIIIFVGIATLFYIAKESISISAVPTLQQYIASSTPTKILPTISKKQQSPQIVEKNSTTSISLTLTPVKASKGTIYSVVAKNPTTREKGLSGYESLDDDKGMLFIFPTTLIAEFWMKDMNFPIDIVWINSDKKIVGVSSDVSPESYPKTFSSPSKVQFVLEVNSGFAEKFGLATGTRVVF